MSVILALGIMLNAAACSGTDGKTVKISFVTYSDDIIDVIYLEVGDFYGKLPVPQNTDDYKFIGWYTNEEREGQYVTPHTRVGIANDHKLYAKITYVFWGWEYINGKTSEIVTAETPVPAQEHVTLTANWKYIGNVTLSFVSESESFTPIKIKAGESLSGLPVPKSNDGYTFLFWAGIRKISFTASEYPRAI